MKQSVRFTFLTVFCIIFGLFCVPTILTDYQNQISTEISDNQTRPIAADVSDFVSVWNTSLVSDGSTESNQIGLPLYLGGVYAFTVNWGDSSSDSITAYNQPEVNHTYSTEGVYTVTITGTLFGWSFYDGKDKLKILEIQQWGSFNIGTFGGAFQGCANLVLTTSDALNTTGITSFSNLFAGCSSLNDSGNLNSWNVSGITNMNQVFYQCASFNQSLNSWNTSKVQSMTNLFSGCTIFNGSIDSWNTSKVTSMYGMFSQASAFNQPIGNWNVSLVSNMNYMFSGASSFNQPIGLWNTSSLLYATGLFNYATSFNHSLENWDVSKVLNFNDMFNTASSFNQPLNMWNVSKATSMQNLFNGATSFNQTIEVWNVSQVTDMDGMFYNAVSFNHPLNVWNVSSVTSMYTMFYQASSFNQPLDTWNVSNVVTMYGMFSGASSFDQPLGNWNISKVTNFNMMFSGSLSPENYNHLLLGWSQLSVATGRVFVVGSTKYSSLAAAARSTLTSTYGWSISDGGQIINTISIISPTINQIFGGNAPSFQIFVQSYKIQTIWYTLNNGVFNTTINANGTIAVGVWASVPESIPVDLTFYANNTFGEEFSNVVTIIKDSLNPVIQIVLPAENAQFGNSSPTFQVNITDAHLDSMWYSIDGGLTNRTFTQNGSIDQDLWDSVSNNTQISFRVYANDSAGNLEMTEIQLWKTIFIAAPGPANNSGENNLADNSTNTGGVQNPSDDQDNSGDLDDDDTPQPDNMWLILLLIMILTIISAAVAIKRKNSKIKSNSQNEPQFSENSEFRF